MLAFCLYKEFLKDVWFFEEENVYEFVLKFIVSFILIIPCLVVFIIDIILIPVEIIALILYIIKQNKKKLGDDKR